MDPEWVSPVTTRSRVVTEIASELVGAPGHEQRQALVLLRDHRGNGEWTLGLFGSSTVDGIEAVAAGRAHLAIVNPAAPLTLAYRGNAPFDGPQPVLPIAVIPSEDQLVFAVSERFGLTRFEEIATRRAPLEVLLRGQRDHCVHLMLDHVAAAAGFSLSDIESWGGALRREGGPPLPGSEKYEAIARGEVDAVFDEAAEVWVDAALAAGMRVLPLAEATLGKLTAMGYHATHLQKSRYPRLDADIPTIDFSGWPIFVHADLPGSLVRQICSALYARRHAIPWEGRGPLPVERMCRDAPDTPLDLPLHPAAEAYWREQGFLS